ncbi:MAG: RagB/SusD family nutrient uptake outer membrane protein, partial [Flavobacteriales bacterium]|nr:RagB/SusD family nutrient uptake outer membrane protein [Flavobacteriales bacterium]
MIKKSIYSLITLCLLGVTFESCTKRLDLEPKYGMNSATVYNNPENYVNVLAKIYAGL